MKKQLVKLAKELAIELFAAAVTTAVSLGLAMFLRHRL